MLFIIGGVFLAEEEPTLPGDNIQGYYKFSIQVVEQIMSLYFPG